MGIFIELTAILWAILVLFWIVSAFGAKKKARGNSWWRTGLGIRLALVIILIILIRVGVINHSALNFLTQPTTVAVTPLNILIGVIGVVLCAAGVAFAIWARIYLGKNWGMPMTLQEGHELVTSGPYKLVRHPIYTGFLLVALGSIFTDGLFWLIVLICAGIYFIYSAKTEEKIMTKQFPNEYPDYMKRTKMLVPFIL